MTMTKFECAKIVLGHEWANVLWPVLRYRKNLIQELIEIQPKFVAVSGKQKSNTSMYDLNTSARMTYISERCAALDHMNARQRLKAPGSW